jgi:hypothetical protein
MNARQFIHLIFLIGITFISADKLFAKPLTLEIFLSQVRSGNPGEYPSMCPQLP